VLNARQNGIPAGWKISVNQPVQRPAKRGYGFDQLSARDTILLIAAPLIGSKARSPELGGLIVPVRPSQEPKSRVRQAKAVPVHVHCGRPLFTDFGALRLSLLRAML
jgi:hypothetical protein